MELASEDHEGDDDETMAVDAGSQAANNLAKPSQLYRSCSLGLALTESLREMVAEGLLSSEQALQVEKQYDESMALGMTTLVKQYKVRPGFDPTSTESNWKRQAKKRMLAKESELSSAPLVSAVECTTLQGTIGAINSAEGQWRLEAENVLVRHPIRSMRVPHLRIWLVEEEPPPPALARAKPLPR